MLLYTFIAATITDPGLPTPVDPNISEEELPNGMAGFVHCAKCNMYRYKVKGKRRLILHCPICDVCIESKLIINYLFIT